MKNSILIGSSQELLFRLMKNRMQNDYIDLKIKK